jgi:glycosyltransferase involved in cell wall biosynthesis
MSKSCSVIMTCYNEGPFIEEAVRSVLDQTREDLIDMIVIADDGSAPNTIAVLRTIETLDPRIRVLYGSGGRGLPGNRNVAADHCTGDYVAILDGDDLWAPTKLEEQCAVLDRSPAVGLVYAGYFTFPSGNRDAAQQAPVIDISGSKGGPGGALTRRYFLNDPPIIPSTVVVRRDLFEKVGRFDANIRVFEDTDFFLRLSKLCDFALVSTPLLYKRGHPASITGGRKDLMAYHAFVALKAAAEDSGLLALVPQRLAERARKLGNQRFLIGDHDGARALAAFALRLRPSSAGGWAGYLLARLPRAIGDQLRRTVFRRRVGALQPPADHPCVAGPSAASDATRVLYVINAFNRGGAEKGLLQLMRGGAFAGCAVRVVSIVSGQGAYVEELRAAGATVEHLGRSSDMGIAQWLLSVPRLWRIMASWRPDLVILSLPQANIAGRVASMLYRKRCIVASFEHNTHLAKAIYERLFRWTSWRVDWMLADCATTATEAGERLYRSQPDRTVVLPLVSVATLPLPDPAPTQRPFTLLSAGRFTAVKNQRAMIEAVALLRDRGVPVRLILFGEGELMPECRKSAEELLLRDCVVFRGFVPDWAETSADAFLLASRHEGLCIVAIEAMSRGLAVIAPRVGGLQDYGDAAKALLLDHVSPASLADAIERVATNPELHAQMRLAGLRMAEERFSAAPIAAIYQQFSGLLNAIRLPPSQHA